MTVLVAEDHPVNMKIIRFMLEKESCMVHGAENGLEAVRLYRELNPDLIIMDIQMPEMDGLDACREIRRIEKEEKREYTPISALSANASTEDREEAENAGMDDFVSKPVTIEDIHTLLGRISEDQPSSADKSPLPEIFVYNKLLELFGGDREIIKPLLEEFLAGLPGQLARIEKLAKENQFDTLERAAHTLKGQCLNLHAGKASEAFANLERAAREEKTEEIQLYREKSVDAVVELIGEVNKYI
jgi:CheY-like chemotaxis protein